MRRVVIYLVIALVVFCAYFSVCSKKEGVESEKGKIEKMTDEAADAIVKKIRTPMDQARSAKETEEERARTLDEALKDQ